MAAEAAPAKLCQLHEALGCAERCPGAGCPLWEDGFAVLDGGCVIERLSLDLARRPDLAHYLLEIRLGVESVFGRLGR